MCGVLPVPPKAKFPTLIVGISKLVVPIKSVSYRWFLRRKIP
jgi:hypothetical protein